MPAEPGSENSLIAATGQTVAKNMTHGRIMSRHYMQGIHSIAGTTVEEEQDGTLCFLL
jgi:hypothetical protein